MPARRPTIADVARVAGVSKGAVSFALNDRPGVAPATRQRILAAAEQLGWHPSTRARSLSHARAYAMGLVVRRDPGLLGADPFFPAFIAGVETELSARGQSLVLQVVPNATTEEAGYRRLARDGRVDGVFLLDLRSADPRIGLLRELGLPAVTLNRPDRPSTFPAVVVDDEAAVAETVRHLVELGHRRIGHVAGPDEFLHAARRRSAWERELRALGLEPGPVAAGDFTPAGGAAATRDLLSRPDRPTALVYANDLMAVAGLTVAHELGLRVPEDVAVAGFDDSPMAAYVHPPLTTARIDVPAWGRAATRLLLDLVEGQLEGRPTADVELPPARLVVRGSTGATRRPRPEHSPVPPSPRHPRERP